MDYNFREVEKKWQSIWAKERTFQVEIDLNKPKYYILDMFPYPSGAGLHVGHPLGYIASDILSRFKRLQGFNVLHPMGYDSFGLPAEQYAIQTGQHPSITTDENIRRYRDQLDQMGFSYDWSRELRTSEPGFYKWTQWIFSKLYVSWYNLTTDRAEPIEELITIFTQNGNKGIIASGDPYPEFTASEWMEWSKEKRQSVLMNFRMAYLADSYVNWCPGLGTVLANEEVKDGYSERGGFPVERKKMRQWFLKITAYADRLLNGLESLDWPEALKEMQRNWIGLSKGSSLRFQVDNSLEFIEVFTTRPDTIYGCTFLVLAPEHELTLKITVKEQKAKIEKYIRWTQNRSERDRMSEVKKVTGEFTGACAIHPFTGEKIPIWIADYVLAGYGTGAVMAVPCGDERDYRFAQVYDLPIVQIMEGYTHEQCYSGKDGTLANSEILNGLSVNKAIKIIIKEIEFRKIGKGKNEYRMRDAGFSRQRYWGEPIPIFYDQGIPYLLPGQDLPLVLPEVDKYLPTESGEPPLGRAKNWVSSNGFSLETNTMPGWAGSSWYYLRYEDPQNNEEFASKKAIQYWGQVDLYMGGSEHATGHLLYVRFWTKFLKDLGYIEFDEPAKKLVNQGMIQGRSNFVYQLKQSNIFISEIYFNLWKNLGTVDREEFQTLLLRYLSSDSANESLLAYDRLHNAENNVPSFPLQALHVDVSLVDQDILNVEAFKASRSDLNHAQFIFEEDGKYHCGHEVEKMSKSKYNVVNPDQIIDQYGADTLRLYEMFLGPLEMAKPWNTHGIEGVSRFLKKFWRLFHDSNMKFRVLENNPSREGLKILHKTIRKIEEDLNKLSFNTSVSQFMICTNELSNLEPQPREILEPLVILLSPYAPHICEELWLLLRHKPASLSFADFPKYNPAYLVEQDFNYPISINGKLKMNYSFSLDLSTEQIQEKVLEIPEFQKYLACQIPKKIIVVKGRIINLVV